MQEYKLRQSMVKSREIIVVLSSGRSGSSLVMSILNKIGMELSDDLIPGRYENPEGYFEDSEIVSLHNELLAKLNTLPSLPLPHDWLKDSNTKTIKKKLKDVLKKRLESVNKIWGFKDPRICNLLPMWNNIFNTENVIPKFIFSVRNPAVISQSLKRYINRKESITELQWLERTSSALIDCAADCFIVHYEDWFGDNKEKLLENLIKYTGLIDLNDEVLTSSIFGEIVKPNLNRSKFGNYVIKNKMVMRLYNQLSICKGDNFDRDTLLSVANDCKKSMVQYEGWFLEAQKLAIYKNFSGRSNESIDSLKDKNTSLMDKLRSQDSKCKKELNLINTKLTNMQTSYSEKIDKLNLENFNLIEQNKIALKDYKELLQKYDINIRKKATNYSNATHLPGISAKAKRCDNDSRDNLKTHQYSDLIRFKNESIVLKNSYSFRLGQILINAVMKPGINTILVPKYFFILAWDIITGKGREKLRNQLKMSNTLSKLK